MNESLIIHLMAFTRLELILDESETIMKENWKFQDKETLNKLLNNKAFYEYFDIWNEENEPKVLPSYSTLQEMKQWIKDIEKHYHQYNFIDFGRRWQKYYIVNPYKKIKIENLKVPAKNVTIEDESVATFVKHNPRKRKNVISSSSDEDFEF